MTYQFLTKRGIVALHQQQILEHGGSLGIREDGLLESTLAKAQNLLAYVPESKVWDLAAVYGYGFIQNHVFVDGNKRVGLASMAAFLYLNGYEMTSTEAEEVSTVLSVATGNCSQEELAVWVQRSIVMVSRFHD
ncbi:MAG: type II toxin-antitoxin system death-on-curing family toxin [Cyanobacteria bacterium J06598_3]